MPFSAAGFDTAGPLHDPLGAAACALAERGVFGAVWLDRELNVAASAGAVPKSVERGMQVTQAFVALIGLEDELAALQRTPDALPIRIPNTAVMSTDGHASQRMNLTVFWFDKRQLYLVLMGAILSEESSTTELDQEIRRRRLIEQDLAAKSIEYVRINEQLEQFAYVISHDLNGPLRALRYLSTDIQKALALDGGDGENPHLGQVFAAADAITTQTRRMSKMLTDLLEYARIGRVQEVVEVVATKSLISEIVTSIAPATALTFVISGDWPEISTAVAPLDLVLRNLVENAVKHHDQAHGKVEINCQPQPRDLVFRVIDDGRGIAPEWQSAIFEPFRKIDDAHHPESSGIGLALVKKTVTALAGSITVHSGAPEQRGTTFQVRWPLTLVTPSG